MLHRSKVGCVDSKEFSAVGERTVDRVLLAPFAGLGLDAHPGVVARVPVGCACSIEIPAQRRGGVGVTVEFEDFKVEPFSYAGEPPGRVGSMKRRLGDDRPAGAENRLDGEVEQRE